MGQPRNIKYELAYDLYLQGFSLKQVADKIGVTRQGVFKAFQLRGLKLRGPNFQPIQEYDGKKFTLGHNGYYRLTTDSRILIHRYIWEKEKGKIPKGWDIHHIDEDKTHNEISNLECLTKAEHTRKYSPRHNQYTHTKK